MKLSLLDLAGKLKERNEIKLDMPFVYKLEKELAKMGINSHADKIDQLVEDIWASK